MIEKQFREGEQLGYFWSRVVVAGDSHGRILSQKGRLRPKDREVRGWGRKSTYLQGRAQLIRPRRPS